MTEDALPCSIGSEVRGNQLGQFARDVAVHPVMRRPRRLGRVHIEACAEPEVPARVVARKPGAARARVGRDQHQAEFGGEPLRTGLDHERLFGAGQSGQVVEHRHATIARLRRLVDREAHLGAALAGIVREVALGAAEAGVFGEEFHGLYRTQLRRPRLGHARVARLGIEQTLRQPRREEWLAQNASGIEAYNRNIDRHGAFSDTVRGF